MQKKRKARDGAAQKKKSDRLACARLISPLHAVFTMPSERVRLSSRYPSGRRLILFTRLFSPVSYFASLTLHVPIRRRFSVDGRCGWYRGIWIEYTHSRVMRYKSLMRDAPRFFVLSKMTGKRALKFYKMLIAFQKSPPTQQGLTGSSVCCKFYRNIWL